MVALSILFVITCIILVLLILVQSDKGGGLSSAVGGGMSGANSVMGAQNTENILTRGTVLFAVLYIALTIVISLGVARNQAGTSGSEEMKKAIQVETEL
jgi:preprotein translocase subunit SecG